MKLNQEIRSNFQMIGNYVKKVSVSNDFLELPPMEQLNYNFEAEYDNVKIDDEEFAEFRNYVESAIGRNIKIYRLQCSWEIDDLYENVLDYFGDDCE